ncbi:MAG: hypothetical protein ABI183_21025 [Polyangiaceae bacterium]
MSRTSFLRVGQAFMATGIAVASLCAASGLGLGCGDTVANNEGPCVAQASIAAASGCDSTKESYYTCPGARVPTLDAGSCTLSKVHGGFCCPLPTQAGNASQNGQIVDIITSKGVAGVTVALTPGVSGTSDSAGNYLLQVPQNTPFNMVLNGPNYAQLTEQEWQLTGDFNVGPTHLVPASLQIGVYSGLPSYDDTKATLGVGVEITGACPDNAGAVITFGDPNAKIMYFKGTTPDRSATSVNSGSVNPSALIYNIDPASTAKVTITPPAGCTNVAYPYTAGAIVYTGNFKLSVGSSSASFFRGFIQ